MEEGNRFDFAIDEECIEIYDNGGSHPFDGFADHHQILCILTIDQALQLQKVIKESLFEWAKTNKKPLDHGKSADK